MDRFAVNMEFIMPEDLQELILSKMEFAKWTTVRALLTAQDEPDPEEIARVETAMHELQAAGKVVLWRLAYDDGSAEWTAAASPDFDLGAELERRGARASATRK
jgi:hypothetical protein